jgi:hypothetical protein
VLKKLAWGADGFMFDGGGIVMWVVYEDDNGGFHRFEQESEVGFLRIMDKEYPDWRGRYGLKRFSRVDSCCGDDA